MNNKLFCLISPQTNTGRIFRTVYDAGEISRQEISEKLGLSLPTIRQSINELLDTGVICTNGYFESTGGRKASVFSISPMSKVSIGVELLKDSLQISAVNLLGEIIKEQRYFLSFSNDDEYFERFGDYVNSFVESLGVSENSLLEVQIAVQGIVSQDGDTLVMGKVLGNSGMTANQFREFIYLPCRLVNDTEASAFAELWSEPETVNAAYIMLNMNLGGAIIINGRVFNGRAHNGTVQNGGIIGHMRLVPGGKQCYCGRKGCFQAYCSALNLEDSSGMGLDEFLRQVDLGNAECRKILDDYLSYLALGINNIRMLIECEFILGGYLEERLSDKWLSVLANKVNGEASFDTMTFQYRRGVHGSNAPSRGAALMQINDFIMSIK